MSPRVLLLVLILSASATFVVGVALERSGETSHHETRAESTTQRAQSATGEQAEGGESATAHAAEAGNSATHGTVDADAAAELRPLGINVEAWPFVIVAVLASLALAIAAWQRPDQQRLLALVAAAMLAFAVLDAREIAHQIDINKNGLAILAGVVSALHLAAAAVAASMALRSRRPHDGLGGRAGTMAA